MVAGVRVPGYRQNPGLAPDSRTETSPPCAYERLILYAMRGDAMLFTRNDEVEAL